MNKMYCVYIITNHFNSVLYTVVTNDLKRRIYEHCKGIGGKFTDRYKINKLVYFEYSSDIRSALEREKQIKGGSRRKKEDLIYSFNPEWRDLDDDL